MLRKKNRANRRDLEKVFKKGFFLASPNLTFKYIKEKVNSVAVPQEMDYRISFVVPKSVSKRAVVRNSLRRKGYSILEKNIGLLKTPVIGAFVFKKTSPNPLLSGEGKGEVNLENEIQTILKKL